MLWRITGEVGEAQKLVPHQSSFHTQRAHPHPIFSPDDNWVASTSDATDYRDVYLARVGSIGRDGEEGEGDQGDARATARLRLGLHHTWHNGG